MKAYGIETHWNGTQYYYIGRFTSKEEAFKVAKDSYKWFAADPDIKQIKAID